MSHRKTKMHIYTVTRVSIRVAPAFTYIAGLTSEDSPNCLGGRMVVWGPEAYIDMDRRPPVPFQAWAR
ncbi:uncharacterized protein QC761_0002620 [Podospora bellae-mahoneyi]|uniref:Uncharacterized protein n=1 Tax=Podospora bellae-mahoneyi TaxID=2093777 RepID=A0ABR0FXC7_9PEZI|nr:hypothetical protein QC761_0002620 [Podospora bellae-mahoneyi]